MASRVILALPCFNEGKNILPLLDCVNNLNQTYSNFVKVEILIIDDCSTDNTPQIFSTLRSNNPFKNISFKLIRHKENGGLTGGINTAFQYFFGDLNSESPAVAYGLMDGDNSHSPFFIPQMLEKIFQNFDVVIASRFRPGARVVGVSKIRQILSFGLTIIFKCFRNISGVRDYSCGYRLYSPRIISLLERKFQSKDVVKEKSFASMVEILLKCHLLGAFCTEIPFLLRYDLKLGESKMPFVRTILGNLKILNTLRSVEAT